MPWSSSTLPWRRAAFAGGYALAALLAAAEIVILGLALNPKVHPDYRAFYLDETTTCLNRDRVGGYTLGETVEFRHPGPDQSEKLKRAEDMKVCGWTGPAGDGTHSLGEMSRLRLRVSGVDGDLAATLEMVPVPRPPQTQQRVIISVNGTRVHEATLAGDGPREVAFTIPREVLGGSAVIEMEFAYPDSIPQTPVASRIYDRAIKLLSFRLDPAR